MPDLLGAPPARIRTRSQGSLPIWLVEQQASFASLSRMLANARRLTPATINLTLLQRRMTMASQLWEDIKTVHRDILSSHTAEEAAAEPYIQQDLYGANEEIYLSLVDLLATLHNSLPQPAPVAAAPAAAPAAFPGPSRSVPRLTIPQFSGDHAAWDCFHDLFKSIIVDDPHLRKVEKFQHLKTRLVGEALTAIQNIPVTESNFDDAWALLESRYSNKHLAIFTHVSQLLNLPQVSSTKQHLLRALIDQTRSIVDSLRRLGEPVDTWSTLLVVLTVLRLDRATRQEWDLHAMSKETFPTFTDLEDFIVQRIHSLSISEFKPPCFTSNIKCNTKINNPSPRYSAHASTTQGPPCAACNSYHSLASCDQFKQMSSAERVQLVQKRRFCYNCLRGGHFPNTCSVKNKCVSCRRKHHTLLHEGLAAVANPVETPVVLDSAPAINDSRSVLNHLARRDEIPISDRILLATAFVRVSTPEGRSVLMRALIDQGSERSFIAETAAQALRVTRQPFSAVVSGIGDQPSGSVRHVARVKVSSQYSEADSVGVDALILNKLTSYVPRQVVDLQSCPQLHNLQLADDFSNKTAPIMLILGADVYGSILREGILHIPGMPTAQKTMFGWILSGRTPQVSHTAKSPAQITSLHIVSNSDLHESLEHFWRVEEVPKVVHASPEDLACEKLFQTTTTRDSSGRYCVALPFKQSPPLDLGDSYDIALRSYHRLEKRLARDAGLAQQYNEFLQSYLSLGHMSLCDDASAEQCYYIPHHPVVKEQSTSTKVRVVFNASCPTSNGRSLNDHLHIGPKLHQELPAILLRWRRHRFVCTADITKMFRQIMVKLDHARYQMILWRPSPGEEIQAYTIVTVAFGLAPAPYLSQRVVLQLVLDEGSRFPLAAAQVPECIYVDDALFGASSIEECLVLREEMISLLNSGCLPLKKWSANDPALLLGLAPTDCELDSSKTFQEDAKLRILGTSWNPTFDQFYFEVRLESLSVLTKRTVFSQIAKLFDPLGLVAPVVVVGKIFMQKLWLLGLDWDTPLSTDVAESWRSFCNDLVQLAHVRIPRWIDTVPSSSLQLHGFCDASQDAYAAVAYLRVQNGRSVSVHLLSAKTRVAPIKPYVSIPRLELCGAELLSRLLQWCHTSLKLEKVPAFAWSDSSVTLHWISDYPVRWKVFVANRVSAIQSRTLPTIWNHVPTDDNPADIASRGATALELQRSSKWWHGPEWLSQDETHWPTVNFPLSPDIDLEEKVIRAHVVVLDDWDLEYRYSDWGKLLRVTSLLIRFVKVLRSREAQNFGLYDVTHISLARETWYRYVQARSFQEELVLLSAGKNLPRSSRIAALDPFVDTQGVLRVGGRLHNADLPDCRRHPVILADHAITRLIVKSAHLRVLHGGSQLTARLLREQFWILRARTLVRGIIAKCVTCVRHRAQLCSQKMAPLPAVRVNSAPPFASVGVDYAGPFFVRNFAGRGHKSHKAWVALFVCLRVKAVHLELVMDCSTASFLAAFRRLCSRRGVPSLVLSDNGTNFHGADRELQRTFQRALKDPTIESQLASEGITWRFIPPASPHFGGIWESGVKSMKHHLRRVISSHTLTLEEFQTLLCQVEACLNSRPLTPLYDDPNELAVLTPGHFLIGRPLCSYPEPSLLDSQETHLTRWQVVKRMRDAFWKTWRLDYLAVLQKRNKWLHPQNNLHDGIIVLLLQDNCPPAKWPLGRVVECIRGTDGLVRVCRVKTAESIVVRPVHKLCVLPVDVSAE